MGGALSPLRPHLQASGSFPGLDSAQRLWPLLPVPEGAGVGPSHPPRGAEHPREVPSVLAAGSRLPGHVRPAPFPGARFSLPPELRPVQSLDGFPARV